MPLSPGELRRGRICQAIYPFAAQFPIATAATAEIASVEELARRHGGQPVRLVTEVRLRPILLLHDGTRGDHGDVICLRVNSIKAKHRRDSATWARIRRHEHPRFFHLPKDPGRYGLTEESVVALASLGTIHKSAILGPRAGGQLNRHEMRVVSERVRRILSLDLAPTIAREATELLRRARVGARRADR